MKNLIFFTLFLLSQIILNGNGEEIQQHQQQQHQINLEDIEHDNILNERKLQQSKEHGKQSIQQHFRPANTQYEQRQQIEYTPLNVHGKDDNINPPSVASASPHIHKIIHPSDHHLQYVTPATAVIPDHHHSPHTYVTSAISSNPFRASYFGRQTPFKPIIPKQNVYLNQQQQKHQEQTPPQIQPQFVYLQSTKEGSDEQGQHTNTNNVGVGGITYANPQDNDAYTVVVNDNEQIPQHTKATREDPTVYQQKQQHLHQQQQQQYDRQPAATEYLQYVPVIAHGPSPGETFIMMAPLPAGNKALAVSPSVVAYSHSSLPTIVPLGAPSSHLNGGIQYAPIPSQSATAVPVMPLQGGIQYLNSNDIQSSNVEPQNIHQDIQYANPNEIEPRPYAVTPDKSKQLYYAPRHPDRQGLAAPQPLDITKLQSLDTHKVIPLQYARSHLIQQQPTILQQQPKLQQQQIIHHTPLAAQSFQLIHPSPYTSASSAFGPFDLFSSRKAKSLLDSYIPSWVVIQKQRSLNQNNIGSIQDYAPLESGTYNTIAYSAPESHQGQRLIYYSSSGINLKRSPKGQKTAGANN